MKKKRTYNKPGKKPLARKRKLVFTTAKGHRVYSVKRRKKFPKWWLHALIGIAPLALLGVMMYFKAKRQKAAGKAGKNFGIKPITKESLAIRRAAIMGHIKNIAK